MTHMTTTTAAGRAPASSRGAALLCVLAVLALLMPLCLGISRSVATSAVSERVSRDVLLVDDLLLAAELPIQEWLANEAGSLVLPPDARYPAALVLDDHLEIDGVKRELRVVAWDQLGLVPLDLARAASPLRLALPRDVVVQVDAAAAQSREGEFAGLDWFEGGIARDPTTSPFPPSPTSVSIVDGATRTKALRWPASGSAALGSYVATHGSGAINVASAPLAILEAALRELGRGGLDLVVAARSKGERPAAPIAVEPSSRARDGGRASEKAALRLVSSSDCFAFRIDARAGRAKKSWWSVYRTHEGGWRLEQRLLVPAY